MSILLWVLQILLAVMFVLAGAMKAFQPYDTMARRMPWVEDYSPGTVRAIGALEILVIHEIVEVRARIISVAFDAAVSMPPI